MSERNLDLYNKALNLRRDGKSYGDIKKVLNVSKGTLSGWFSKIEWSVLLKDKLSVETRKKNYERIRGMNKVRSSKISTIHDFYKKQAYENYLTLKNNPLFISAISLYWGEGDKANKGRVAVINSDNLLLKVIINFYRNILKIPESKIRCGLFIYADIEKDAALSYWSETLDLNKENFIKTQVLPSRSVKTKRKVNMGMCSVYFSSVELHIKIQEWLKLLANDMRE